MQNELFTKHLSHAHINTSAPPQRSCRGFCGEEGGASDLIFICSIRGDKAASLTEFLISRGKRHLLTTAFISSVHGRAHASLCLCARTAYKFRYSMCVSGRIGKKQLKIDFTLLPQECVAAYKIDAPFYFFM